MKYINEESKFWDHSYLIHIDTFDQDGYLVNANNEQDALDILIDYLEEKDELGAILVSEENYTKEEMAQLEEWGEAIRLGNHGHLVHIVNMKIVVID